MRTRHLIGAALMGVLLVLSLTVAAQTPGPYAAQVQQAIRSLLAGTAGTFTTMTTAPTGTIRVQMTTPATLAATPSQSGTDLTAGVYTITVTSLDAIGGQTLYSTPITCTVTAGGTGRCAVTWAAVQGTEGYRVWTSLADAATPTRYFAATANSYNLDTLTGATVATLPTNATAYSVALRGATSNWITSGPFYGGLEIASDVPLVTTNKFYNNSGTLTWNGTAIVGVYPGAGLAVSTGSAWGTSLSSTAPIFITSGTIGAIATQSVLKFLPVTDASPFTYTITAPDLSADAGLTLPNGSTTLVVGTMAPTSGKLSQFAATTSAEFAGVISDEIGSGLVVLDTAPSFASTIRVGAAATYDGIIVSPIAKGANQFDLTLSTLDLTAARAVNFPDAAGTIVLTPASLAADDIIIGASSSTFGRLPLTALQSVRKNAANDGMEAYTPSVGAMTLIGQAEGTDATAAATNVATFAISGLTVKDRLRVILHHGSATQATAEPVLYSTTDSKIIASVNQNAAMALNTIGFIDYVLGCDPVTNTLVFGGGTQIYTSPSTDEPNTTLYSRGASVTLTTAWTGSWTLALRTGTGGVTAGGTYRYRIAVFKIAGQ